MYQALDELKSDLRGIETDFTAIAFSSESLLKSDLRGIETRNRFHNRLL